MERGPGTYSPCMSEKQNVARFHTTRWSVVLRAGVSSGEGRAALEELCRTYWFPLYALARRRGVTPEQAEDAVQSFFADFLARGDVARADRGRGRFRSFLSVAFRNFLSNERERARALKRGGGVRLASLDVSEGERRYVEGSGRALDPEELFDRTWALALLETALGRLRADYARRGQEERFDALRHCLTGEPPDGASADTTADGARPDDREPVSGRATLARRVGLTDGALKVAIHRLRERYREAVAGAVRDTVNDDSEVEEELAALFRALGS